MSVPFAEPHRFTVEQFHRMAESGILSPDDRVELIDGEIVEMTPMGPRHASRTRAIFRWLERLLENEAVVSMQLPVDLGFAEPYPDVSVARWREDLYEEAHPAPTDVLLVIEVSDSTILYDRNVKSATYAQGRIPEFWVVDLPWWCSPVRSRAGTRSRAITGAASRSSRPRWVGGRCGWRTCWGPSLAVERTSGRRQTCTRRLPRLRGGSTWTSTTGWASSGSCPRPAWNCGMVRSW